MLDQVTADVRGDAVAPLRTGRELERDTGELRGHVVQGAIARDLGAPVHGVHRVRVHETVGQPGSVGKQVLDGHRRGRLFGDEPFVVAPIEYLELGPRLDVFGHRVVELEAPFLVEHHERRTRNRLGHRIEAQHGVALHPPAAFYVRKSALVEERFLTTARYQAHCARVLALVHVAVDMRRDAPQPVRRKAVGHPSFVPQPAPPSLGAAYPTRAWHGDVDHRRAAPP